MTSAEKIITFAYAVVLSCIVASVGIVALGASYYLRTR